MRVSIFALAAATLLATPAVAQDTTGSDATGIRAELRAGLDRAELGVDYDDGVDSFEESDGTSGIAYGGEVGFDFAIGATVIGPYVGLDFANTDYCSELFGADELCIEAGRNISLGLRAGAPVGSGSLLYVKGGYSNGRATVAYEDFEDILEDFSESDELNGFHIGAGAETRLGANAYGKLEYVYTKYDSYEYADADLEAGVHLRRHQVLAGLGFRF